MSDQTPPQREIDRRPIRRFQLRPLGENAATTEERFETVLTDPSPEPPEALTSRTSQEAGPEDAEEPRSGGRGAQPSRRRFTTVLALLLLGLLGAGLLAIRPDGPAREALDPAGSGTVVVSAGADAFSVAPLPLYAVPREPPGTSSVSPLPMASEPAPQASGRPDPAEPSAIESADPGPSEAATAPQAPSSPPREVPGAEEEGLQEPSETAPPPVNASAPALPPLQAAPGTPALPTLDPAPRAPSRLAPAVPRPVRPDMVVSALQPVSPSAVSAPPAPTRNVSLPPLPDLRPELPAPQAPRQVAVATSPRLPWSWPNPASAQVGDKKPGTPEEPRSLATYLGNPWLLLPPLRGEH